MVGFGLFLKGVVVVIIWGIFVMVVVVIDICVEVIIGNFLVGI